MSAPNQIADDLACELDRLVNLFRYALATPNYGRDALSAQEADEHIEAAERALRAASIRRVADEVEAH